MTDTNDKSLFKFKDEYFQVYKDDSKKNVVILSAEDNLAIGTGSAIGSDYSGKKMVNIFAEALELTGEFKNHDLLISSTVMQVKKDPCLNASGKNGAPPPPIIVQGTPAPGKPGQDGGSTRLYLEQLPANGMIPFILSTKGGNGANGQDVEKNDKGGAGGDGGRGGTVVVIGVDTYRNFIETILVPAYNDDDVYAKLTALKKTWINFQKNKEIKGCINDGLTDIMKNILKITPSKHDTIGLIDEIISECTSVSSKTVAQVKENVNEIIKTNGSTLTEIGATHETALHANNIDIRGGRYGHGGRGKAGYGDNGNDGAQGSKHTFSCAIVSDIFCPDESTFFKHEQKTDLKTNRFPFVHPVQCNMMLEKIKMMYLTADVNNKTDFARVAELFYRLIQRTGQIVKKSDDSNALYDKYSERLVLQEHYFDTFKEINSKAKTFLDQLKHGKDYYGHKSNYAPILSFHTYYQNFEENLENFRYIEQQYLAYFDALDPASHETPQIEQLKNARDKFRSVNSELQRYLDQMRIDCSYVISLIDSLDSSAADQKQDFINKFEHLKQDIRDKFNFNITDFIKGISTCAANPGSILKIFDQSSQFIYKGLTTIDTGPKGIVEKKYVISQIDAFKGDLSSRALCELYKQLPNGQLEPDDPGAAKLFVEKEKLDRFLSSLYSEFPEETEVVKDSFQKYVNLILQRNNKILEYNSILILWNKYTREIQDNQKKINDYNDDVLQDMHPELPAYVSFLSSVYHNARAQVVRVLYETAKAYRFFDVLADDHTTIFGSIFGTGQSAVGINATVLAAAKVRIINNIQTALEAIASNRRNYFAGSDKSPIGTGVLYELNEEYINVLKEKEYILFTIPTCTRDMTSSQSPFSGMANVRLTRVRPWIFGIKKKSGIEKYIKCEMVQLGAEEIAAEDGSIHSFEHQYVHFQFHFDPVRFYKVLPNHRTKFNTKIPKEKIIREDGIVGQDNLDINNPNQIYAAIGPFAVWKLSLKKDQNQNFDLAKMNKIIIEFCGSNSSFISKSR